SPRAYRGPCGCSPPRPRPRGCSPPRHARRTSLADDGRRERPLLDLHGELFDEQHRRRDLFEAFTEQPSRDVLLVRTHRDGDRSTCWQLSDDAAHEVTREIDIAV